MYQEPCCISRKLPAQMRAQSFSYFQTSGDVPVSKMMEAVSQLADGHLVFFLVIPEVDVYLLRLLRYYVSRGWYEGIILLTQTCQTALIRNELSEIIGRVSYGCHRSIFDGAMAVFGVRESLYIQGPMLLDNEPSLCAYSAYLGHDENTLRSAMEGYFPKIHLSRQIESTDERVKSILNYIF